MTFMSDGTHTSNLESGSSNTMSLLSDMSFLSSTDSSKSVTSEDRGGASVSEDHTEEDSDDTDDEPQWKSCILESNQIRYFV
jgi:hypothetical protein